MSQLPIASKEDLVYSESSNYYRLLMITNLVKEFEPLLHYGCGEGSFLYFMRQVGYKGRGYDWRNIQFKKHIRPESSMTTLTVNLFDSLKKLEQHMPAITEMTMFGGVWIMENPFYYEEDPIKIGLPWTETLGLMEQRGWVYQFNLLRNMPLFANKNNGTKIRRK